MKKSYIIQILLGAVVILICTDCQFRSYEGPRVTVTTTLLASEILVLRTVNPDEFPSASQETVIVTNASTQINPTSVWTQTPTLTSTPTRTPTPTLIPVPTLNAEESRNAFSSLMETNGNCEFPCLWGWEPEASLLSQIQNFLFGFGQHDQAGVHVSEVNIDRSDFEGSIYVEKFQDGVRRYYLTYEYDFRLDKGYLYIDIQGFKLSNMELGYYSLPNILSIYGKPEQIFVSANTEEQFTRPTDWLEFSLALFYPQRGVYIEYLLTRTRDEIYFYGCPDDVRGLYVFTWNSNIIKSATEIMEYPKDFYQMRADYHFPLTEVNNMTPEEFTTIFRSPSASQCLRVPKP